MHDGSKRNYDIGMLSILLEVGDLTLTQID